MKILTPQEPLEYIWRGALATQKRKLVPVEFEPGTVQPKPGRKYVKRKAEVNVGIGMPFQWQLKKLLGQKWNPPEGNYQFYFVRFAFSVQNLKEGNKVVSASFCVHIQSSDRKSGYIFDAYPQAVNQENSIKVALGFGPDLKLGPVALTGLKAETTIEYGWVYPLITTTGLQQSTFCWKFSAHPKFTLEGSRQMYATIALPAGVQTASVLLDLEVICEDDYGLLPMKVSQSYPAQLEWEAGIPNTDPGIKPD